MFSSFAYFCAVALAIGSVHAAPVISSEFEYPYGLEDVTVVKQGETFVCVKDSKPGYCIGDSNIEIQIAVRNKAFKKDIGVRYTNETWFGRIYEAPATFTKALDKDFELWKVTLPRGLVSNQEPKPEYEIAAYASFQSGPRVWDSKNNYFTRSKVTPAAPAANIYNNVNYNPLHQALELTGGVRSWSSNTDLDYKKGNVIIRWTIDNWKTFTDSPADPPVDLKESSWGYSIRFPLEALQTAEKIEFAFKYTQPSTGKEFWNNNYGANYQHSIKPHVRSPGIWGGDNSLLGGFNILDFYVLTDLDTATSIRIDNGPDVYTRFDNDYRLDARELANGKHNVTIRAGLSNGPNFFSGTFEVEVVNKIQFKDEIKHTLPQSGVKAGSAEVFEDSIFLGLTDGTIVKFDTYKSATPSLVYKTPAGDNDVGVYELAVDASAVYALNYNGIFKFNKATGTIDTKFGSNGLVSLVSGTRYDGTALCYSHRLVAAGDALFLEDSCNFRILKFSAVTGSFVSSIPAKGLDVVELGVNGGEVLVALADHANNTLTIGTIDNTTGTIVSKPSDVFPSADFVNSVVVMDGHFVVLRYGTFVEYLKDGKPVARWNGGDATRLPGQFNYGTAILPLSDGTFLVSDSLGNRFERFDQKIL
ncbi:hypothetical protein HDU97_009289 [Phlyctochytrium planicorne]|nr:hypothetical protein HDU97_009289 [Phlyctochytrium planicorne]